MTHHNPLFLVGLFLGGGLAVLTAGTAHADERTAQAASKRAEKTLEAMTPQEKTILTHGILALQLLPGDAALPAEAIPGAGYIAGIPRLGVPALFETDASLGVSYVFGIRKDGATALPSGLAQASTWNPALIEVGGRMIGSEARAKGFNVLLSGGVNLMRDPRNGRNFEYLGEDPLLAGTLVGHAIRGVQSNNIISTIKHFALNGQETGRKVVDSKIDSASAYESDLLAFKIGIEIGDPGSVMCAYNKVNGKSACDNDWLLNKVLKQAWGYKGFVMSDWGAVPSLGAALNGLDQQSGQQLDTDVFFADKLAAAAKSDPAYALRLDDMNRRILWAMYDKGLVENRTRPGGKIDFKAHGDVAEQVARQGIVLLRNARGVLPLAVSAKRIVVIGGYANSGVLSGGGSSQVQAEGGPALVIPAGNGDDNWPFIAESYHSSVPIKALREAVPDADIRYRNGRYVSEAVAQAKQADVAIIFATQWTGEGFDVPDMSLPNGQDALIAAVAAANPNTIVVLESGGPVLMPWLDKTAAVVEAWYPGARGAEAIAAVLTGKANPSGRLPITFPASEQQLPRPKVDGLDSTEPSFLGMPDIKGKLLVADYDIEGSDLGYRWNAFKGYKALFPFGYGLSYTSFVTNGLKTDGSRATVRVANTGKRDGATVAQLYLVSRAGKRLQRLVGFQRVELTAGQAKLASMNLDARLLAEWQNGSWSMPAGEYGFALGEDAEHLGPVTTVRLKARAWRD